MRLASYFANPPPDQPQPVSAAHTHSDFPLLSFSSFRQLLRAWRQCRLAFPTSSQTLSILPLYYDIHFSTQLSIPLPVPNPPPPPYLSELAKSIWRSNSLFSSSSPQTSLILQVPFAPHLFNPKPSQKKKKKERKLTYLPFQPLLPFPTLSVCRPPPLSSITLPLSSPLLSLPRGNDLVTQCRCAITTSSDIANSQHSSVPAYAPDQTLPHPFNLNPLQFHFLHSQLFPSSPHPPHFSPLSYHHNPNPFLLLPLHNNNYNNNNNRTPSSSPPLSPSAIPNLQSQPSPFPPFSKPQRLPPANAQETRNRITPPTTRAGALIASRLSPPSQVRLLSPPTRSQSNKMRVVPHSWHRVRRSPSIKMQCNRFRSLICRRWARALVLR